ncbi:MAG: protein kinase [Bacteroidales bacterium]|nr:protein kinase [Bacteroidales bacterium]
MMLDSDFIPTDRQGQEEVLFDSGGTADCYKLIKDNRIYCVKRPKPQYCTSEAYMSLFRKEFELGINLEHPNIVRYFAYDTDERGPFIRMDFVDGDNLEEFIAQHPDYLNDKNNRKQFLEELFSAIDYLHEKGLLHLDLKPRNILITNKGHHVKLIDLGFGWSESFVNDLGYTRDYCAPEQLAAKTDQLSPATDIYALGKILQHFRLANGKIINHCLKEDPKERFQSIEALKKAIRRNEMTKVTSRIGAVLVAALLIGAIVWSVSNGEEPLPPRPAAPEGAINGLFTINSAGDQVYFSKGNLQYKPSTNVWRFAENQYEITGGDNSNITQGANCRSWLDLFGWSSNGREHGSVCWQPWRMEMFTTDSTLYNAYGVDTLNLYDRDGQADWGYNVISNGGNEENVWRTLKIEEWDYLLEERYTASGIRYAKAMVNNVNGLLLLPDNWDTLRYHLEGVNNEDADYHSNFIPEPFWTESVESQGAVFLPAAGIRDLCNVALVGNYGFYWSSSIADNTQALGIYFSNSFFYSLCLTSKYSGRSVRLVRDKI